MADHATVYNATSSPLVVDRPGRVIGAREFGVADVEQQPAKGLLEDGQLVAVDVPDAQLDDEAIAPGARRAAKLRNERAKPRPDKDDRPGKPDRTPSTTPAASTSEQPAPAPAPAKATTTTAPAPAPRPTTEA